MLCWPPMVPETVAPPPDPTAEKQALRRRMTALLAELEADRFRHGGLAAAATLPTLSAWQTAERILLFLSLPREIDTGPLLDAALATGKTVYAPRVCGSELAFYRIAAPDGPWDQGPWDLGPFGIREPPADPTAALDVAVARTPTLVVVPGLAFDAAGNRLGRGKGFYDRFLASFWPDRAGAAQTVLMGLCLPEQLVSRVPAGPRDRRMDAVCTGIAVYP